LYIPHRYYIDEGENMDKKLTKNVKSDFDEILSIIEKSKENEKLSLLAREIPCGK